MASSRQHGRGVMLTLQRRTSQATAASGGASNGHTAQGTGAAPLQVRVIRATLSHWLGVTEGCVRTSGWWAHLMQLFHGSCAQATASSGAAGAGLAASSTVWSHPGASVRPLASTLSAQAAIGLPAGPLAAASPQPASSRMNATQASRRSLLAAIRQGNARAAAASLQRIVSIFIEPSNVDFASALGSRSGWHMAIVRNDHRAALSELQRAVLTEYDATLAKVIAVADDGHVAGFDVAPLTAALKEMRRAVAVQRTHVQRALRQWHATIWLLVGLECVFCRSRRCRPARVLRICSLTACCFAPTTHAGPWTTEACSSTPSGTMSRTP